MTDSAPDPRFYQLRDSAYGDIETAKQLIAADPSILEARSGIGETALHFLVVENELEAVEFLRTQGSKIDTKNDFGDTPLMDAATLGRLEMCQYLIRHGADFRHVSAYDGGSAFSEAATSEKFDVLTYLLGLLTPDEDLNFLFSDVDAEIIMDYHKTSAQPLLNRGLKKRWPDE